MATPTSPPTAAVDVTVDAAGTVDAATATSDVGTNAARSPAAAAAVASPPQVAVILFTKDRPFQCREALRSLGVGLGPIVATTATGLAAVHVIVARGATPAVDAAYTALAAATARSEPPVEWCVEAPECGFAPLLVDLVTSQITAPYVLFMVDDALWLSPPALAPAADLMDADPRLLAYLWKLAPNVCYSHPSSSVCEPPATMRPVSTPFSVGASGQCTYSPPSSLTWALADGAGDWGYAWDLCAGMYRRAHVAACLDGAAHHAFRQPNALEVLLNTVWAAREDGAGWRAACPTRQAAVVVTRNRVQDVCHAPVYAPAAAAATADSFDPADPTSAAAVAAATDWDLQLDVPWYAGQEWDRVHVGAWRLRRAVAPGESTSPPPPPPSLSIVMPAHNAANWIGDAVASIVTSALAAERAGEVAPGWELVLVDDASTDGSAGLAAAAAAAAGAPPTALHLVTLPTQGGLVAALNAGMAAASGDLLARMDADDLAAAVRLRAQAAYLRCHPEVGVVGSGVLMFSDTAAARPEALKVVTLPTHPELLRWHAWFMCPLAHPTVVIRRSALVSLRDACTRDCPFAHPPSSTDAAQLTPYTTHPTWPLAEDYALWLHLAAHVPTAAAQTNLGAPLLAYRKHAASVSVVSRTKQRACAAAAVGGGLVAAGWRPAGSGGVDALAAATAAAAILNTAGGDGDGDGASAVPVHDTPVARRDALAALRYLLDASLARVLPHHTSSGGIDDDDAAAEARAVATAILLDAYARACVVIVGATARHGCSPTNSDVVALLRTFLTAWVDAPLPPWLPRSAATRITTTLLKEPTVAIATLAARACAPSGGGGGAAGASAGGAAAARAMALLSSMLGH